MDLIKNVINNTESKAVYLRLLVYKQIQESVVYAKVPRLPQLLGLTNPDKESAEWLTESAQWISRHQLNFV